MIKQFQVNIYIDGANMFYAQQKMGWFIDWQKVRNLLEKTYSVNKTIYYTGIKSNDQKTQKFNAKLKSYGFIVKTKPLKKINLSKKEYIYKANFDVEIAVDLILDVQKFDYAILFSGDSDFKYIIEVLKKKNKQVIICSSRGALSKELVKVANKIILLGNIRKDIEFKKKYKTRPEGRAFLLHLKFNIKQIFVKRSGNQLCKKI